MDDKVTFIRAYLKQSDLVDRLRLQASDEYFGEWRKLRKMWLNPRNERPHIPLIGEATELDREDLANLRPRALYKASSYVGEPTFGSVVRCACSAKDRRLSRGYYRRFDVVETEKGLKIAGMTSACVTCRCTGSGGTCSDCGGDGWIFRTGTKVEVDGAPVRVERFEEPEDERYLEAHRLER